MPIGKSEPEEGEHVGVIVSSTSSVAETENVTGVGLLFVVVIAILATAITGGVVSVDCPKTEIVAPGTSNTNTKRVSIDNFRDFGNSIVFSC